MQFTAERKLLELVGQRACATSWSDDMAKTCYRAAQSLHATLTAEESTLLEELYSRITRNRSVDEVSNIMNTWGDLNATRDAWLLRKGAPTWMEQWQVREIIRLYHWYHTWYDLTWEQAQHEKWDSNNIAHALLNKRSGWTYAAKAIAKYGLPKFETAVHTDDATEHINAFGAFLQNLAKWLKTFAADLVTYRHTDRYQERKRRSTLPE